MTFEDWWVGNKQLLNEHQMTAWEAVALSSASAWNAATNTKLKPLTDDEITEAVNSAPFRDMVTADDYIFLIARAVEKAILEKSK